MAAARRHSPIFLLRDRVDMGYFTDKPGLGWEKIACASKRAHGCGQRIKEAVEGLNLYARLGDDPPLTSSLAIRLTDEAFRMFDSEIQLTCRTLPDRPLIPAGVVEIADEQGLTVILLIFRRQFCRDLAYYLVYDNATASLSLIHLGPDLFEAVCSSKPVAKRNGSGDFELFVMASEGFPVARRFLGMCTPETRANQASSDGAGPWLIKKPFQQEEFKERFIAQVAFSFQSKGIWADLSRGIMYCDLDTSDHDMDFGFIELPRECLHDSEEEEEDLKVIRTMSCVGDSIWFVRIDRAMEPADDLVKMWTLKGNLKKPRWEKMGEVRVSEIWEFDGFKEARLPNAPLEYPLLTANGALCVKLADQRRSRRRYRPEVLEDDHHICIFDMSLKRLQWRGVDHNYIFVCRLLTLSDLLESKLASSKRKLGQLHPAVGLAVAAVAGSKQWVE